MTIYQNACADCGHKFEALVRCGSTPECPTCDSCGDRGGPGSCAFS